MTLIDKKTALLLSNSLTPVKSVAGGSSANSLADLSFLGGTATFIGITSEDEHGRKFNQGLSDLGITVISKVKPHVENSGQSYILVTPDGNRTMLTYLGSSGDFSAKDINIEDIITSKVFYVQNYIINPEHTMPVLLDSFDKMHESGGLNAFALSSVFMVKKNKAEILKLLPHMDIIFGNDDEFKQLYDLDNIEDIKNYHSSAIKVVTMGAKGALIFTKQRRIFIPPPKVTKIVDTIGAGDAFAGGFLYAFTHGYDLKKCGQYGSQMAGLVLTHLGGRPLGDAKDKKSIALFKDLIYYRRI
jgi:sugar/nucleoside kinase (ribokinase family)